MKTIYTNCWHAIATDGQLTHDQEDTLVGMDLWICVLKSGAPFVYSGYYLMKGLGAGFFHSNGQAIAGKITHYMIRDFKPEPPALEKLRFYMSNDNA